MPVKKTAKSAPKTVSKKIIAKAKAAPKAHSAKIKTKACACKKSSKNCR